MTADLFGFLMTTPSDMVKPVHPKAITVILTTLEDCDAWLAAPWDVAAKLQRPLADGRSRRICQSSRQEWRSRKQG